MQSFPRNTLVVGNRLKMTKRCSTSEVNLYDPVMLSKLYYDLAERYQKYYAKISTEDIWSDPTLAADAGLLSPPSKESSQFKLCFSEHKKHSSDIFKLKSVSKNKTNQDSMSTPMSPLNRSQESESLILENKVMASTDIKQKKTCSANHTMDSQDDCQVINLSDSDSNIETDQLNSFFNEVQYTDELECYVSHFEGGGRLVSSQRSSVSFPPSLTPSC
jgi:hypothetical protein